MSVPVTVELFRMNRHNSMLSNHFPIDETVVYGTHNGGKEIKIERFLITFAG